MAKNVTIIPGSGSLEFTDSNGKSIKMVLTGSLNDTLMFVSGSIPIMEINPTTGLDTNQTPRFNEVPEDNNLPDYLVYNFLK